MPDFPADTYVPNRIIASTTTALGWYFRIGSINMNTPDTITANRAHYYPLPLSSPLLVVKMFIINGATVAGNVDVGIYTAEGQKIVSSGSTAQAGASAVQEFDIADTLLNPGFYYLALAGDTATSTFAAWTTDQREQRALGCFQQDTAFPLPATATFAGHTRSTVYGIWATSRTVV